MKYRKQVKYRKKMAKLNGAGKHWLNMLERPRDCQQLCCTELVPSLKFLLTGKKKISSEVY